MLSTRPGRYGCIVALLALGSQGPAVAAEPGPELQLGLQSEKRLRGLPQSGGDAVASADARWRDDGPWRAHAGLSTLGRDPARGTVEALAGLGWGAVGGERWDWLVALTHYRVLGGGAARRPAYDELSAAVDWDGRFSALVAAAPGYPGLLADGRRGRGRLWLHELGWHQRLAPGWALDVGLGRALYDGLAFPDYGYGSLGLSYSRGRWTTSLTWLQHDNPAVPVAPRLQGSLAWRP